MENKNIETELKFYSALYKIPLWYLYAYYNNIIDPNTNKEYHSFLFSGRLGERLFEKLEDGIISIKEMIKILESLENDISNKTNDYEMKINNWVEFVKRKSIERKT